MSEFRRKSPRKSFAGTVGILHRGHLIINSCLQIGEGGALVQGHKNIDVIEVGDPIVFTLFFPQVGGVVTQASCLYRSEQGHIGISFQDLGMDFKKRIREYVSRRKQ